MVKAWTTQVFPARDFSTLSFRARIPINAASQIRHLQFSAWSSFPLSISRWSLISSPIGYRQCIKREMTYPGSYAASLNGAYDRPAKSSAILYSISISDPRTSGKAGSLYVIHTPLVLCSSFGSRLLPEFQILSEHLLSACPAGGISHNIQ